MFLQFWMRPLLLWLDSGSPHGKVDPRQCSNLSMHQLPVVAVSCVVGCLTKSIILYLRTIIFTFSCTLVTPPDYLTIYGIHHQMHISMVPVAVRFVGGCILTLVDRHPGSNWAWKKWRFCCTSQHCYDSPKPVKVIEEHSGWCRSLKITDMQFYGVLMFCFQNITGATISSPRSCVMRWTGEFESDMKGHK